MFLPAAPRSSSSKHIPAAEHGFHLGSTRPAAGADPVRRRLVGARQPRVGRAAVRPMGQAHGCGPVAGCPDQGEVDYLLEISDPCQHVTYEINGVEVSDFVTPGLLRPGRGPGRALQLHRRGHACRASCFRADTSAGSHGRRRTGSTRRSHRPPSPGTPKPVKARRAADRAAQGRARRPHVLAGAGRLPADRLRPGVGDRPGAKPPRPRPVLHAGRRGRRRTGIRCAAKST